MSVTASISSSSARKEPLSPVERELVVAVLDDTLDQLSVLNSILPAAGKPSATTDALTEALSEILENQRQLEEEFYQLQQLSTPSGKNTMKGEAHGLTMAAKATRNIHSMADNLEKLKRDQKYLYSMFTDTLTEVAERGTLGSLQVSVDEYHKNMSQMEETVKREHDSRQSVKELKKLLTEVKREKEEQVNRLDEEVAHCKDQLQELKARTGLINKYVKKQSEVKVQCSQQEHHNVETSLEEERERLKQELDEEKRVHAEIENYLKKHIEELDGKVEYWMARYEEDLELKTNEVQDTKSSKTSGLLKLDDLSQTYKEREEVVIEHRAVKEQQRRKEEQEKKENMTATKLQAWWRGIMVRKGLGQFKKGGKKKGKKGKKDKKKGKKKKGKKL